MILEKKMASKAYGLTAYYDALISEWFNREIGKNFLREKLFWKKN